jgi:hypothetical protein
LPPLYPGESAKAESLMPSWWRPALILTLMFSFLVLVVTPSTIDVASAGPQLSGISSSGIDFADDLDDNFDLMLVAAIADGPPDPSRPLPVGPERSGPAQFVSVYHPPDRAPPAPSTSVETPTAYAPRPVAQSSAQHQLNEITSIDHPSVGEVRPQFARPVSCASTSEESALTARRERNHHG